jgi:hypothetical protein
MSAIIGRATLERQRGHREAFFVWRRDLLAMMVFIPSLTRRGSLLRHCTPTGGRPGRSSDVSFPDKRTALLAASSLGFYAGTINLPLSPIVAAVADFVGGVRNDFRNRLLTAA